MLRHSKRTIESTSAYGDIAFPGAPYLLGVDFYIALFESPDDFEFRKIRFARQLACYRMSDHSYIRELDADSMKIDPQQKALHYSAVIARQGKIRQNLWSSKILRWVT